jgi:hypothetical protein
MNAEPRLAVPIPDPTALTTDQILREVAHLQQLIEERIAERDLRYQQRAEAQQRAVEVALETVQLRTNESTDSLRRSVENLAMLTEAKFVTFRALIDSQTEKTALALSAADKAVSAALAAAEKAVGKSETSNEKRFEQLATVTTNSMDQQKLFVTRSEVDTMRVGLGEKIDALKEFSLRTEGRGAGINASWGYLLGAIGLASAVITIILKFNS